MGIFSKNHVPDPNVKRNTFDLSFQNNLTMQIGTLYPCFCKEVLPGDTFKIDTAFGLRFMPLVFPIQTKMRADVHFFYVRNRNLWDEWPNFIGDNSNKSVMPYKRVTRANYLQTGSLGDYLGLPTTVVGTRYYDFPTSDNQNIFSVPSGSAVYIHKGVLDGTYFGARPIVNVLSSGDRDYYARYWNHYFYFDFNVDKLGSRVFKKGESIVFKLRIDNLQTAEYLKDLCAWFVTDEESTDDIAPFKFDSFTFTEYGGSEDSGYYIGQLVFICNREKVTNEHFRMYLTLKETKSFASSDPAIPFKRTEFRLINVTVPDSSSVSGAPSNSELLINVLPFRAYESIYNAFYRDQRNNPYIVDGEVKPNQYIPTKAGGYDDNVYNLHHRNWEQDFLTSALPSPQMGAAPLVGLTSSGVATYQSEDGTLYNVKLQVADDGDTVVGAQYTSNLPNDVARSIVNIASSGISINDFRAVNSLQRWLEANFRKGLKYKDQLAAHFGVQTSYAELDMPEFIGGCSQSVDIQQINQTSESTSDNPLGSYAGQAYAVGGSNNTIQHYCDEHGYIIGIISVVPVPCYSQLLPKHFTKMDTLDYYFPEFGHIGMQPIPYREVCPLQAHVLGYDLNGTFGYQRPFYDYLASTDEVHGQFRTTLKDFVLQRVYKSLPSLSPDFLTVDEKDLNNVFAVEDGDHILGQIHFKVHAKRPIPRYGIPRLE